MPKALDDLPLAFLRSPPRGFAGTAHTASAMGETRKLAAILVADVAGYSRLAGADEAIFSHDTFRLVADATDLPLRLAIVDLDEPRLCLDHLGQFDVVLYLGVFYHLIDPIAATRALAVITREVMILETHIQGNTSASMVFTVARSLLVIQPTGGDSTPPASLNC